MDPLEDNLLCSFCGKTQGDVEVLIYGPAVYICDECVKLCSEIIEDQREKRIIRDSEILKFQELWGTDL